MQAPWSCVLAAVLVASVAGADPLPGAVAVGPELAQRLEKAARAALAERKPRTRHLTPEGRPRFTNRLALEQSPYLLQHAHNPVNWYPWGQDAFDAAREQGRPVLLSIGYSTCHWCHVMEEQSFENLAIAEFMNTHYIAIKVDREERPDIDDVYMTAVQAISGSGGWPMTVWLTPEGKPFFGGTYFPPKDSPDGRPGFRTLLEALSNAYEKDRARIATVSQRLADSLRSALVPTPGAGVPSAETLRGAIRVYRTRFDGRNGGLQSQTKFPSSLPIGLLLRAHRRTGDAHLLAMARQTLDAMRRGGLYDHVGGGFHRYTTEPSWTVPHFEKMLYDNALLVIAYLEGYQVTGERAYAEVVRDVLAYVAREMTAADGSFYAATDADSEGEEGRFFVWTRDEIRQLAGPELAELAMRAYGVSGEPNFEDSHYVLRRDETLEELAEATSSTPAAVRSGLESVRAKLRAKRSERIPPDLDDKRLVAWNGLMISAFARAALVLRDPDYLARAGRAARALLDTARPGGRLARYLRGKRAHGSGLLDDHAFLCAGLLDLFEASGEGLWLDAALEIQRELDTRFLDAAAGAYWISPEDGEKLLVRGKPGEDGAVPSGNSIAVMNLLRLHALTTDESHRKHAELTLRAFSESLGEYPSAHSRMLEGLDFLLDRPKEILIVTPHDRSEAEPFLRELASVYLPNRVLVVATETEARALAKRVPLLKDKRALDGRPTAYVCEARVCELPAREVELFARQIRKPALAYPGSEPGS